LHRVKRRRATIGGEVEGALVGSLVLNRFLIERRIGSGGFGVVYEAWDGRLERNVAVKAIESHGEAGRRVLREAQAAARLNHPGIVTLYEMGEEDGNALLVTELVDGTTLAQLSREAALSDREIAEIGADLCEALDHAHSRGVVHRDIKPQNVLVAEDSEFRARLMDFGIAQLADGAALTAPGDVVGTLAYMAPEQAEGRTAGPEADVYSLALMLYECWSGENPNRRATPAATARAIGGRPRPLRRLRPDLPRELSDAIDAALQPRPSHRPALEEIGSALEESLDQLAAEPARAGAPLGLRFGAIAAAAVLGAWLAMGHGVLLP
jgi:eukaryotic-like serine/threonine-protein kinase